VVRKRILTGMARLVDFVGYITASMSSVCVWKGEAWRLTQHRQGRGVKGERREDGRKTHSAISFAGDDILTIALSRAVHSRQCNFPTNQD
jgi:hypothetical protein